MTENNNTIPSWLIQEEEKVKKAEEAAVKTAFVKLPAFKLTKDNIEEFTVDFSEPFKEWYDEVNDANKAKIPVLHGGVKKLFWLNKVNPLYAKIIKSGKEGITTFKVKTEGFGKKTKYEIVN